MIAGGRQRRATGWIGAKPALRLAGGLPDLGLHDAAAEVLGDAAID